MRVAILTQVPPVAFGYSTLLQALGHETVVVIAPQGVPEPTAFLDAAPDGVDVVFPATKRSLAALLRAYDADVGLCTGFPWLVTQEAIDTPRLGIVNGHPTLLPRGRGPHPFAWAIRNGETEVGLTYHFMDASFDTGNVLAQKAVPLEPEETEETLIPKLEAAAQELLPEVFAKLEAGDPGVPQQGGEYQHPFEPEYAVVDPAARAADVHRQVRAWSFMPDRLRTGPTVELDGRRVRIVRSSLTEVDGAERLDCSDGPLWIVESVTT
ncbi:MAG: methionyl-tRNA formyltransferase [Gaiellaceae bacterium]